MPQTASCVEKWIAPRSGPGARKHQRRRTKNSPVTPGSKSPDSRRCTDPPRTDLYSARLSTRSGAAAAEVRLQLRRGSCLVGGGNYVQHKQSVAAGESLERRNIPGRGSGRPCRVADQQEPAAPSRNPSRTWSTGPATYLPADHIGDVPSGRQRLSTKMATKPSASTKPSRFAQAMSFSALPDNHRWIGIFRNPDFPGRSVSSQQGAMASTGHCPRQPDQPLRPQAQAGMPDPPVRPRAATACPTSSGESPTLPARFLNRGVIGHLAEDAVEQTHNCPLSDTHRRLSACAAVRSICSAPDSRRSIHIPASAAIDRSGMDPSCRRLLA